VWLNCSLLATLRFCASYCCDRHFARRVLSVAERWLVAECRNVARPIPSCAIGSRCGTKGGVVFLKRFFFLKICIFNDIKVSIGIRYMCSFIVGVSVCQRRNEKIKVSDALNEGGAW
jgi:hypothetical protein